VWGRCQNEAQRLQKGRALLGSYPPRGHSLLRGALSAIATLVASLAARFASPRRCAADRGVKLGQYLDLLPSGNPSGEVMRVLYPHTRYTQDVVV
jgi:hypothetical protein